MRAGVKPTATAFLALIAAAMLGGATAPGSGEATAAGPGQAPAASKPAAPPAMLPERTLECRLRRATNLDPSRDQEMAEIRFEGEHRFALFLPAVRAAERPGDLSTEIPDAGTADPRIRILADPGRLAEGMPARFGRAVDHWPVRVELSAEVRPGIFFLIILDPIDATLGKARLFMTYTNDTLVYDLSRVHIGVCDVRAGAGGERVSETEKVTSP
jgi:hypothetical protein